MRTLACSCQMCFKSLLQWKLIVDILQPYPSVHRTMSSLRSTDSYLLHRSVVLESYIAKVIQLKSKELRWQKNLTLQTQLTELLTCFLSKLDAVDVECLSSLDAWAGCIFPQQGTSPLEMFSAQAVWHEHAGVTVLEVSQDMSGSILSSFFWVIW